MAWVNICSKTYDSNYAGAHVKVVIQYDNSSVTTTSLTCRAIGYLTDYNGSYGDTYFIYSNGGGISRICYLGGTSTKKDGSSYYTSNSFTLTKASTTSYFTLPELRLCNDGSHSSNYTDSNGRGWAIYWNNQRHMWTTVNSGGSTISTNVYVHYVGTPPKPAAPKDNYNNTFSASCDAVGNPGNNPVTTTIQYWLDSSWIDAGSRSISGNAHTALPAADSQTVYVRVKADPTYGDTLYSDYSYTTLKNYVPPALPTVAPSITKSKTRFTVKEPWVVSWTGEGQTSTKVNNTSPVAGYRVVLRVKKATETEFKSVPIKNKNGTIISKNPSSATWHTIDTINLGGYSITIYPDKQGFEPGDKVIVGIRPYILWGAANPTHYGSDKNTNKLFNERENLYKYTDEITVQNAGVVRVKTGTDKSSFKEGIVWVKINNTGTKTTDWVEADVVKVKTSNGWKESE